MFTRALQAVNSTYSGGKAYMSNMAGAAKEYGQGLGRINKMVGPKETAKVAGYDAMRRAKTPMGMSVGAGAAVGGAYGAISDDTSVMGGMAMGAAGGFGGNKAFGALKSRFSSAA